MNGLRKQRCPPVAPLVRRLVGEERGATMALVALALTVLLLFTGLALDFGRAHLLQAQLQTAVDAGALAGALQVVPMVSLKIDRWKAVEQTCLGPRSDQPYPCLGWTQVSPATASGAWRELIGQGGWRQAVVGQCGWPYRCESTYQILREWLVLPPTTEPAAREALLLNATWPGGSHGARLEGVQIEVSHTRVSVKASATLRVPTHFLRLIGIHEMRLTRSGTASNTPRARVSIIAPVDGESDDRFGSMLID